MSTPKAPIRVYDQSLNLLVEIDAYQDAYFERSLSGYGDFCIQINWNIVDDAGFRQADYFARGNFVQFGTSSSKCGIILEVEKPITEQGKGSQLVKITGKQSKVIFSRRVVEPQAGYSNYTENAKAETVMRNVINAQCGTTAGASRQIALLNIAASAWLGTDITYTSRYKGLADDLTRISVASSLGFNLDLNTVTKKLDFVVIPGLDRTAGQSINPRCIISTDYDTLKSGNLKDSEILYKNTIYAAGQGIGVDRNIRKRWTGSEPTGLDRRESFEDMRDLSIDSEIDARGDSVLAENNVTKFVDASSLSYSQYVLDTDYSLGDYITLSMYGESTDVQITSIKESWGAAVYNIDMSFNRNYPELPKTLAAQANATKMTANQSEGVVVMSGENVYGRYWKYSDGSMLQTAHASNLFTAANNAGGGLYYGNGLKYWPMQFYDNNISITHGCQAATGGVAFSQINAFDIDGCSFAYVANVLNSTGYVYYHAWGRWRA